MRILWYTSVNELDFEMQQLFRKLPGYDFSLAIPEESNAYFFPVGAAPDFTGVVTEEQLRSAIRASRADILVHRYRRDHAPILQAAEKEGVPTLVWVTEQGPDRDLEWDRSMYFRNIATNNIWDDEYYKRRGADNVYYWPFGCLPWFHRPVPPQAKFQTDFVGYGNPIYTLFPSKRESVDTIVVPVVAAGFEVALWGIKDIAGGWLTVPGVAHRNLYKGIFSYEDLPAVNSSAKIVLGITTNGRYGAFGSRLARALGCRSLCIWHYSEGMEEMPEGYRKNVNCTWSSSPAETLELAAYYLHDEAARERVAAAGQALAYERLNYVEMVPPILADVISRHPSRPYSVRFEMQRSYDEAFADDRHEDAMSALYRLICHDVTSVTYRMCLNATATLTALGKTRLAEVFLQRYKRLLRVHESQASRQSRIVEFRTLKLDLPPLMRSLGTGLERLVSDLEGRFADADEAPSTPVLERPTAVWLRTLSEWELFLTCSEFVPLDRRRLLLAGDVSPRWAEFLENNAMPTRLEDSTNPHSDAPDCLLYFALTPSDAHATRLASLLKGLHSSSSIAIVWRASALDARAALDEQGVQIRTHRRFNGHDAFDFELDDPLAGVVEMATAWTESTTAERLEKMLEGIRARLDPRICHVTLDPVEILKSGHAWAEGMVRVMQRACDAEGLPCRPVMVRSPRALAREREHCVLEVSVNGTWSTWDPMLGIGFEHPARDLLRSPELSSPYLGLPDAARWEKYGLANLEGPGFWRTVTHLIVGHYTFNSSGTPAWEPLSTEPVRSDDDLRSDLWVANSRRRLANRRLRPLPSGAAFATLGYFDEIDRQRFGERPWLRNEMRGAAPAGKRLLEIGLHEGGDHMQWALLGARCTGIDTDDTALNITRMRFNLHGLETELMEMDPSDLQFPDNHFDVVYAFGLLRQHGDIRRRVREIHRVLVPGGIAIVGLFNSESLRMVRYRTETLADGSYSEERMQAMLVADEAERQGLVPPLRTDSRADALFLFRAFEQVDVTARHVSERDLLVLTAAPEPSAEPLLTRALYALSSKTRVPLDALSAQWGLELMVRAVK